MDSDKAIGVCRTCLRYIFKNSQYFSLNPREGDAAKPTIITKLSGCVPELDLNSIKNVIICNDCCNAIDSTYTFRNKCIQSELCIYKYLRHTRLSFDFVNLMEILQAAKTETEEFEDDQRLNSELNIELRHISELPVSSVIFEDEDSVFGNDFKKENDRANAVKNETCTIDIDENQLEDCKDWNPSDDDSNNYMGCVPNERRSPVGIKSENLKSSLGILRRSRKFKRFNRRNKWNNNKSKGVKRSVNYRCSVCKLKLTEVNLLRHLKKHVLRKTEALRICRIKLYKCLVCRFVTKYKSALGVHARTHTTRRTYKQAFKYINVKRGISVGNRSKWKQVEGEQTKQSFACDVCNFVASCKSKLIVHMRIHTGEKPFTCNVCTFKTSYKSSLKDHMRIHTGEKAFTCNECDYQTSVPIDFKAHTYKHQGIKPYKCTECPFATYRKSDVKRHMSGHSKNKPFKCTLCEFRTTRKHCLQRHLTTHSIDKPFKCALCDYRAGQKISLNCHMSKHTGVKMKKCPHCDYQTNHSNNLRNHVSKHVGVKLFNCFHCQFKTSLKKNLKGHIISRHLPKEIKPPFKCALCDYSCFTKKTLKRHVKVHI